MHRLTTCLIACVFSLSSASLVAAADPEATPASGGIASQHVVDVPDGRPFALSPDGRRLAVELHTEDGIQICSYTTDTLTAERCAHSGRLIEEDTAVWSPDSTRLAFTENVSFYGKEPDLWLFDAEAGTVTDLTNDGLGDRDIFAVGTPLDFAPAWSPDGTQIAFARSTKTGEDADGEDIENTTIFRIAATGGDPTPIAKAVDRGAAIASGVRWLRDGTILYTIAIPDDDASNGLWTMPAKGGQPTQIVSSPTAHLGSAVLVDVSTGGQALLLDAASGAFSLVDLATGNVSPLDVTDPSEGRILAAAFSPDGAQILIETRLGLAMRDVAGGPDRQLGKPDHVFAASFDQSGMAWASNDIVFGPIEANWGQVVRLTDH